MLILQQIREGGHRVPGFIGGAALSPSLRGHWYNQSIHMVDVHATILELAGLAARAAPAGVAPVDGVSLMPLLNLSLPLSSPIRAELWIADDVLRVGDYKLITGLGVGNVIDMLGLHGRPVRRSISIRIPAVNALSHLCC